MPLPGKTAFDDPREDGGAAVRRIAQLGADLRIASILRNLLVERQLAQALKEGGIVGRRVRPVVQRDPKRTLRPKGDRLFV